jgi:hypothetical protein
MGILLKVVGSFNSETPEASGLLTSCFRWLFHDDTPHHEHSKGILMGILLKVGGSIQQRSSELSVSFLSCFTMTHHIMSIRKGLLMGILLKVAGSFQQRGISL